MHQLQRLAVVRLAMRFFCKCQGCGTYVMNGLILQGACKQVKQINTPPPFTHANQVTLLTQTPLLCARLQVMNGTVLTGTTVRTTARSFC
jgi:hypothetical protein